MEDASDAACAWLRDEIGLDRGEIDRISAQPEELRDLWTLLAAVFPEPGARAQWLRSSSGLLGGRSPAVLLRAGEVSEVVAVLATLESGAFL